MSHKNNAAHQRAFKDKMRQDGFRQITVWVHQDDAQALKAYADQLKAERLQD